LDLTSGVGSVKGAIEGVVGYDMAGNKLSPVERWLGVLPYVSKVKKAKTILKVEKAAEKIEETDKAVKATAKSEKVVESAEKAVVKSGTEATDATKNRVKPRKSTIEKIKENQSKNEKGELLDPKSGDVLDQGKMDLGHKPGEEWWRCKEMYKTKGSTRKEVIEAENNPDLYHYEERSANQNHSREKPKD
jgi:hypothetical protein